MLPFTTRTNPFRRWEKSANPEKLPLEVKVSGTWVSPGVPAAGEAAPPWGRVELDQKARHVDRRRNRLAKMDDGRVVGREAVLRRSELGDLPLGRVALALRGRQLLRDLVDLRPLRGEDHEPVDEEQHDRHDGEGDLAVACGEAHDPPPSEAGTLSFEPCVLVVGAKMTVASHL